MLIERCLCGSDSWTQIAMKGKLVLASCLNCGTKWLVTHKTAESFEKWYASGDYHDDVHRHPGCVAYAERYASDFVAAQKRLERYADRLPLLFAPGRLEPVRMLDVGAAEGAFVDAARERGHLAIGLEPDERFAREHVLRGTIATAPLELNTYDLVTYHDVIEHVADPLTEIRSAASLLDATGCIVIEVPDVHVKEGEKHYKAEHLWYFTLLSLADLVHDAGLEATAFDYPIMGKLAVFACRPR